MPDERTGASPEPSATREEPEPSAMPEQPEQPERPGFMRRFLGGFREVTYGMATHDMTRHALRSRASMEHLFILTTMGDLVGVPILPPYYSLRLLPYVVPELEGWKRRLLRERDIVDLLG